jgi:8-oxo-dGTP diphosphatase
MLPLIVTAAVIRDGDAVLITRRPPESRQGGMWEFPGGKLDPDESPQECLKREVLEELGIEVAVGSIFEIAYHRYEWGPVLILAFECRPLAGEIRHIEIADHRWVLPQELSRFDILPADLPIIAKLRKRT